MNFLDPTPTAFDLHFRLFGTPVRVHPSFWLFGVLFGWGITGGKVERLLIYLACFFVSILVHEMGHALAARLFREPTKIILFAFGGVAMGLYHQLRGWHRLVIAMSGPLMGFAFLALVWFSASIFEDILSGDPQAFNDNVKALLRYTFLYLNFMNLFWNVMNLLPIYPLDGGQVVREACLMATPSRGLVLSLGISFIFAGLVAIYSLLVMRRRDLPYPPQLDPMFNLIFFAIMAFQSFSMLQQASRAQRRYDDEKQW